MWTDNETVEDLIGFQVHADLMAKLVTDKSMLPCTVGLYGDWGSGKTSVMHMIQKRLDPNPKEECDNKGVVVLYFNGWIFEGYDDAKAALLSSILTQLGEHKRVGPKVRDKAAKLLKSVNWMRVAKLAATDVGLPLLAAYASGGSTLVPQALRLLGNCVGLKSTEDGNKMEKATDTNEEDIWASLIKKHPEEPGPTSVRRFREEFETLLKDSDIESLVVLIDDLDRCSPERILENLEAIKLFLNVKRTAFVIGADPRIVRHAVGVRYPRKDFGPSESPIIADELARDYLEKLVQIPYSLPRLSAAEVESYMGLLYCTSELDEVQCAPVLLAARQRVGRDRYSRFAYPEIKSALGPTEIPSALAASLTFVKAAAPLVTEGLKGNPRQVKRFLNALMLRKQLANVAELEGIDDAVLVKLQVLEYTRPERFEQLNTWQLANDGYAKELLLLEEQAEANELTGEWSDPFLTKWLNLEPRLGKVDLTEYFWMARDRLAGAYSANVLMPLIVKNAIAELVSDNSGRRNQALKLLTQMTANEQAQLLSSLVTMLIAKPGDKGVFSGIAFLVENEIANAAASLAKAIEEIPPESLAPAVGVHLKVLMESKKLPPEFQSVIERLASSNTKVGRALKINTSPQTSKTRSR